MPWSGNTGDFEKRTGITCIFEGDGISRINETVSTAAYCIAQEALTNVARHSRASCVNVVLLERDGVLKLSIVDNGRGFNPAALEEIEELGILGILGMRERASVVGGDLALESAAGRGIRVHLEVPVHD